jgi:hypothetical protein
MVSETVLQTVSIPKPATPLRSLYKLVLVHPVAAIFAPTTLVPPENSLACRKYQTKTKKTYRSSQMAVQSVLVQLLHQTGKLAAHAPSAQSSCARRRRIPGETNCACWLPVGLLNCIVLFIAPALCQAPHAWSTRQKEQISIVGIWCPKQAVPHPVREHTLLAALCCLCPTCVGQLPV